MLEAKSQLSKLVDAVESGAETEIVIARNGKPAARLVPLAAKAVNRRIGIAKGLFELPADFDGDDEAIAALFNKSADPFGEKL